MTDTPVPPNPTTAPVPGRHFGRFLIHSRIVDKFSMATVCFKALGFVPWDVTYNPETDQFAMMGTSPLFRLVAPEEPAPYYTINVGEKQVDVDGVKGLELVVTVLEQLGQYDDITGPLSLQSKVVGGEQ